MDNILDIVNRIENAIEFSGDSNVDDLFRDAADEIKQNRIDLEEYRLDVERLRAALRGVIRVADRDTAEFIEARAALEGK